MKGGAAPLLVPPAEPQDYYGRPILKEPVWKPEIGWYFFAGGLAGASCPLALGAELTGNRRLARRAWCAALAGLAASPPLLIRDLGRPERFLNMLRVFKPTSPMSVGSWILATTGAAVTVAAGSSLTGRAPRAGRGASIAAGLALGPALATYTAVLVADTAIPVWHEARRELPWVFAGSAAASAGAAAAMLTPARDAGPARRLAALGVVVETAAATLMERGLGELAEPYHSGEPRAFALGAKALSTAGSALVAGTGRRSRGAAALGGAAVLAGSVCQRFAIFCAGFASARDPQFVVGPQRRRLDEAARG